MAQFSRLRSVIRLRMATGGDRTRALIEKMLARGVASVEAFCDPPDAVLYPGEAELIARAVDKRRREFRTVRHCARQALRQLGLPPAPVLRGERGEPRWPAGVVGSMTHCAGYRAAAVAHSCDFSALGHRCRTARTPAGGSTGDHRCR